MEQYRKEFPFLESCTYLNTASQGPFPMRTVGAIDQAVRKRANPTLFDMDDAFALPEEVRSLTARLINAEAREIVLTHSTGHGINIAARCLELEAGDGVILTEKEFPSNVYPWLNLKRKGVRVRYLPLKDDCFDIDELKRTIDDRTKILAISLVQFYNGFRNDLEALSVLCRENGIVFFVDGSQAAGALEIDVRKTPVDMLACCGAKWLLSPMGSGFLYVSRSLLSLHPENVGWLSFLGKPREDMFDTLTKYDFHLPHDATRFEVGSPLFLLLSGFRSSLELIHEAGVRNIEKHIMEMLDRFIDRLESKSITIRSSLVPRHRSSILALSAPDPGAIHTALLDHNIHTSVREGNIRVAPHFFNTFDDIDRIIEVINRM